MYYTAASVIEAIEKCPNLEMENKKLISCPKKVENIGGNRECILKFPNCLGKNVKCKQKLILNGNLEINLLLFTADY